MKFFATVVSAALVATGASAQQAVVKNNCADTIYVQSYPFDGSAAGPLTTLATGQTFSENFHSSGSVSPRLPTYVSSLQGSWKMEQANQTAYADRKDRNHQDSQQPSLLRLLLQHEPRLCLLYVPLPYLPFDDPS